MFTINYYFHIGPGAFSRDLSGKQAALNAGRWNHKDTPCIYCNKYKSRSTVEIFDGQLTDLSDLVYTTYQLPEMYSAKHFYTRDLPDGWQMQPFSTVSQSIGSKILADNEYLVISFPSAIFPEERVHLLNTSHPLIQEVKIIETLVCTPSSDGGAEEQLEILKKLLWNHRIQGDFETCAPIPLV